MKKLMLILILILGSFHLIACEKEETPIPTDGIPEVNTKLYRTDVRDDAPQVVLDELEAGFDFFWELANDDLNSSGYGLIPDRFNTYTGTPGNIASIASVGYGLSTIPIGIEAGWITRE
ncbi:MAG: hypothetical protein RBQ71_07135, partial [Acholeplasmataceae bacterium]|nr:hypothetical protein [Acholeplasmataceae bacterium]